MTEQHRSFVYHRLIVGYHGCDRSVAEKTLLTGEHLRPSDNTFDWLGKGIYFWEHGYQRAQEFAEWKKQRGELDEPSVIGAYIHLANCFDLTDTWAAEDLRDYHQVVMSELPDGKVLENRPARAGDFDRVLRYLDCAVINAALRATDLAASEAPFFQTVRGVFVEGDPVFTGAGFYTKTHTQVSVRDVSCILGYFRPPQSYTEQVEGK